MLADKNIHFMAIEGTIGVGKTSLAQAICKRWNAMFIEENFAENPFLPKRISRSIVQGRGQQKD